MSDFVSYFDGDRSPDPDAFVPAPHTRAGQFVSVMETIGHTRAAPDFVPDLGHDLEEEPGEVDVEALVAAALERGRAEATAESEATAAELEARIQELEREREAAGDLLEGVEVLRVEALRRAADDMAALVLAMSRRVIGDSLAIEPDALVQVLRRALENLPGEDVVTIRVRPEDLHTLEGRLRLRRAVQLVTDPDLEGGCVLEADFGAVDASLDAAMEGLTEAIHRWRAENQL